MSQHLPLVAAQPGIWMAEKLSDLPSAWSVAHYVELTGEVDAPLLARAVVAGLAQADTLRMRFTEDNGEVWQWVDDAQTFELPEIIDLRTNIDPHGTARALMQADLQQDLRVDSGKPLVFHQLIQVADNRWYWYQRYHHLLVDGFSFPAITRQIANIYCALLRGEPTPASPFTPFADVVEEYQQYRESEAWQRDAAFWGGTASSTTTARVTFSGTFTGAQRFGRYFAPETGIYQRGIPPAGYATFRCAAYRFSTCVGSLVAGAIVQPHGLRCRIYLYASTGLGGADGYRTRAQRFAIGYSHCGARNAAATGNPTGSSTEKCVAINVTMPNKLSVTAGERQERNRCSVRYSISRYLITNWIFLVFRRKPIPWQPVRLMTLNWPCSRMNTVI